MARMGREAALGEQQAVDARRRCDRARRRCRRSPCTPLRGSGEREVAGAEPVRRRAQPGERSRECGALHEREQQCAARARPRATSADHEQARSRRAQSTSPTGACTRHLGAFRTDGRCEERRRSGSRVASLRPPGHCTTTLSSGGNEPLELDRRSVRAVARGCRPCRARAATRVASRSSCDCASSCTTRSSTNASGMPKSATVAMMIVSVDVSSRRRIPSTQPVSKRKPTPRTVLIKRGCVGIVAQLLSQRRDVHVERSRRSVVVLVPDLVHDALRATPRARRP